MSLRIGVSQWNYLSDSCVDTPGGGNLYWPAALQELAARGHDVTMLQPDRDAMYCSEKRVPLLFGDGFIPEKRKRVYREMKFDHGFPELDMLFLEWRFPIPGRNTLDDRGKQGFTTDLMRQTQLLEHYEKTRTTIVIWDLDHKLTVDDEIAHSSAHVMEPSVKPRSLRTSRRRLNFPFHTDDMFDHSSKSFVTSSDIFGKFSADVPPSEPTNRIAYIGNYYERDAAIDKYVKPFSDKYPGSVHFVGNWMKYPETAKVVLEKWPNITYHDRIAKDKFQDFYGSAYTCPLLAKDSYYEHGLMTCRYLEALYFRCLPIGFKEFCGIDYYMHPNLIAGDAEEYADRINWVMGLTSHEREEVFLRQFSYLDPFNPARFVDVLESVYGKLPISCLRSPYSEKVGACL